MQRRANLVKAHLMCRFFIPLRTFKHGNNLVTLVLCEGLWLLPFLQNAQIVDLLVDAEMLLAG